MTNQPNPEDLARAAADAAVEGYTVRAASQLLGRDEKTIREMIKRGELERDPQTGKVLLNLTRTAQQAPQPESVLQASYSALASTTASLARQNERLIDLVPKAITAAIESNQKLIEQLGRYLEKAQESHITLAAEMGEILLRKSEIASQDAVALERKKQIGEMGKKVADAIPDLIRQMGGKSLLKDLEKSLTLEEVQAFKSLVEHVDSQEARKALTGILDSVAEAKAKEKTDEKPATPPAHE